MILPLSYYENNDVVFLAKDLIGKEIVIDINGKITSGIISETEAYAGITDKASHAYGGRRTKRTETMFLSGGRSYVYICYGIHYLLNVVCGKKDNPNAVLIRGIIPRSGIDEMLRRCNKPKLKNLTNGPAKVCKALGININHNNLMLNSKEIQITENNFDFTNYRIEASCRIGIDYAGEDAKLPYRFQLIENIKSLR